MPRGERGHQIVLRQIEVSGVAPKERPRVHGRGERGQRRVALQGPQIVSGNPGGRGHLFQTLAPGLTPSPKLRANLEGGGGCDARGSKSLRHRSNQPSGLPRVGPLSIEMSWRLVNPTERQVSTSGRGPFERGMRTARPDRWVLRAARPLSARSPATDVAWASRRTT